MKILFVASYNKGRFAPFIVEQAEALRRAGCTVEFYGVTGKGIKGYLKCLPALKRQIRSFAPDIVHAHYGLSGLLASLQRKVPVVVTFHGSDINEAKLLPFSRIAMCLSAHSIFVSTKNIQRARPPKQKATLLPCGVDLSDTQLTSRTEARERMGLLVDGDYVLFAGAFDNRVKNAPLAKAAVALLPGVELIELKGYSREQVTLLMCAADAFLMTSFTEGSPQVVKEAMACGCPIVSVDVGDVAERIADLDGCFISQRTPDEIADKLCKAVSHKERTEGRERILTLGLTNDRVANRLLEIYATITKNK